MIFVADEGIDRIIVDRLRTDGHDVHYVAEMNPGISDEEVLDLAASRGALLVTSDKDFGELVFRQGRLTAGIVLVRLPGVPPDEKAALILAVVRRHGHELGEAFTVVTPSLVRVRPRRV